MAAVFYSATAEPGYYGRLRNRNSTLAPDARARWRLYWEKHESSRSRLGEVARRYCQEVANAKAALASSASERRRAGRRTDGGSTTEGLTEDGESDASLGPWHDSIGTQGWPSSTETLLQRRGGDDSDAAGDVAANGDDDVSDDEVMGAVTARRGGPFRRKHLHGLDAPGTTKGRQGGHRRRGVLEELPLHVDVAIASAFHAARQWTSRARRNGSTVHEEVPIQSPLAPQ